MIRNTRKHKKTALVLSGGGSRGAYEIGVWKALKKLGIKIDMVMGTSVGAINGAMIMKDDIKFAVNLWHELETDMVFDIDALPGKEALAYAREVVLNGGAGCSKLRDLLETYIDEEKLRKSPMEFGLTATEYPSMKGHTLYLEHIPEGRLNDYILASAACFPAIRKCVIDGRSYIDGGYRDNMPVEMALTKGATTIIAVDLQGAGIIKKDILKAAEVMCDEFHIIRCPLDLGNVLIFDKENSARIMRLGYLDTMRHWGKYEGTRYTFKKGTFSAHHMEGADHAAHALMLDPCIVYNRKSFDKAMRKHIEERELCFMDSAFANIQEALKDGIQDGELRTQLILYIARSLRDNEADSIFMQPKLFRLLQDEIKAANFLVHHGYLQDCSDCRE